MPAETLTLSNSAPAVYHQGAMQKLFDDNTQPASSRVVGIAVAANVYGTFDYAWPDAMDPPQRGLRVRVPFGRGDRKTLGVVVEPDRPPSDRKLKSVCETLDRENLFDPVLWDLGAWISRYYLSPLGMTLAAMIPTAVGRHAPKTETVVFLSSAPDQWPPRLGIRQKRMLDELLEARKQGIEPLGLEQLTAHSGGSRATLQSLIKRNLLRTESRPVRLAELSQAQAQDPFDLNDQQAAALAAIEPKLNAAFSVTLLQGVTGSGKTEIYVRAIRQVAAAGKQAILLVPEIALATQTLDRLLNRLPRVAVLHSGLTDAQRAHYYQQIADGHASVVVGPRSAVFAPCRSLGLIIVDEEHEQTYKQDTAPRYHGRDTAVMRASLAKVPILLGSATPSLESTHNVQTGRYDRLKLTTRVRDLPMPTLEVVSLRKDIEPGRIELLGRTLTRQMAAAIDRNEQVILLMNRRGYASYILCPKCRWTMQCDHCTRAMVFHQATDMCVCHYCRHAAALPAYCPACDGKLILFGMGIQRIENELARKFPTARVARMDSDTMTSPRQFQRVFEEFGRGDLDILLGTQMVGKGLDFPRVTLVGVVSADTSLTMPDFRAAERTFQLIVQVAGRAGRKDLHGRVVVQTLHPDEPAILLAAKHDYDTFAKRELADRKDVPLPPYTRMVRFLIRHEHVDRTEAAANELAKRLRQLLPQTEVTFFGPKPAFVRRIKNQFRFEILLVTAKAGFIQNLVALRIKSLCHDLKAEVVVDADPINLM